VEHAFVGQSIDELKAIFHGFLFKCDRLTHFLQQKGLSNGNDLYTSIIKRFVSLKENTTKQSKFKIKFLIKSQIAKTCKSV